MSNAVPTQRATRHQVVWNYAAFALVRSSTLIMTIVLARLLVPADFGLFALALVLVNLFDYVRDFGVTAALVQHPEPLRRIAPTGLTVSIGFGVTVAAAAALAAPVLAAALGNPDLTDLVRVLAIALLVASFNTLPQATLRRGLDFRRRLVPEASGALVKMTVAIGCAVGGLGVWSLVWAQLAGTAVTTLLYWTVSRPAVRFGFDKAIAVALLRFGLPVTGVTFLGFLLFNLAPPMIEWRLGTADVGYYSIGFRLAELTVLSLCVVIGEVLFSALSRLQHDRAMLVGGYLSAVGLVVALTFPVGLGLAVAAPDLVALLYGEQYTAAAAPLAAIAVFVALHSATFHSGDVYKAMGRPVLLTYLSIAALVVVAPAVWIAAGHSILAVALTFVGVEVLNFVVRVVLVARVLGAPVGRQLAIYAGPAGAAVVMAAAVWGAGVLLGGWPAAARLAVLVPLGIVIYLGVLRVLAPGTARSLLGAARRAKGAGHA